MVFPSVSRRSITSGAQSLVFNFSQRDYIRSARLALEAANYALMDARAATAEETVHRLPCA